jgi:hypothetical protein
MDLFDVLLCYERGICFNCCDEHISYASLECTPKRNGSLREDEGWHTILFVFQELCVTVTWVGSRLVTDGIGAALDRAREVAGDKDVRIGGASTRSGSTCASASSTSCTSRSRRR